MKTHINYKTLIYLILFIIELVVSVGLIVSETDIQDFHTNVLITASINLGLSFWKLLQEVKRKAFSFHMMFYFYNFVFLGLSPVVQVLTNWHAWGLAISESEMMLTNIFVFIWILSFECGRKLKVRFTLRKGKRDEAFLYSIPEKSIQRGLYVDIAAALLLIWTVGFERLFFRGGSAIVQIENSSLALIQFHVLRNSIYFILIMILFFRQKKRKRNDALIISFLIFVIGAFPTGLSRYMAGSLWGGLVIQALRKERIGKWFPLLFAFGILVVFPISGIFRNMNSVLSVAELRRLFSQALNGTYNTGNYDSFQMIGGAIQFVKQSDISYGYQFLGALLFFVPRSIWPSKPIGTGAMVISNITNGSFTNVSMPLIGEAYVNFGVIGIVVGGIILGHVVKFIDDKYWSNEQSIQFINLIYPSAMLYFFFVNRGDLLSSGAYLAAHLLVGFIAFKTMTKKLKAFDRTEEKIIR